MPVKIIDEDPVDVEIQDQVSNPLEWLMSRKISTTAKLTADIPVTDETTHYQVTPTTEITLTDATGATADAKGNMYLEIWEGYFQYQGEIIGVSTNTLTLAFPIEFPFTTDADVYIVDVNQNRNFLVGGIGTKNYTFQPGNAFLGDWYINRFMITMQHVTASDVSTYGDIYLANGLTYGIAFCGKGTLFPSETGLDKNLKLGNCLFNIKKNADYKNVAFDVAFDAKGGNPSSPQLYGTSVRKTFNGQDKSGVVIPVRKARGEYSMQIFRDNLDTLTGHRTRITGHLVI